MKSRNQIQNEIVKKLVAAEGGLIILPTGVGKSRILIEFLKEIPYEKVLIVTSTEKLRDVSWPEEIKKWDGNSNVTLVCYQSLHKYVDSDFEVVVLDEIHHVTPLNIPFFEKSWKCVVGMTATEPRDNDKRMIIYNILNLKVVIEMSVEEAVKLKLISPFIITKVEMQLDDTVKNIEAGSKAHKFLTTEQANYNYLTNRINTLGSNLEYNNRKLYEVMIMKRLQFMNKLPSKVEISKKILTSLAENQRTIIFSKSIDSARAIHPYCFHSKTNDKHLKAFMNKTINTLSCVNSLNEGMNIPDMDNAIISQLNSNDLVLTQQLGRVIRFRKDFVGNVFIIIAKDTVDENWFQNATKNLSINETIQI